MGVADDIDLVSAEVISEKVKMEKEAVKAIRKVVENSLTQTKQHMQLIDPAGKQVSPMQPVTIPSHRNSIAEEPVEALQL